MTKETTTPDMLRLAVAAVLEADKEFRANMPPEWGGDPLSDEIDGLRRVYSALISSPGKDGGQCEMRNQLAYIGAYDIEELRRYSLERLLDWAGLVIKRANSALTGKDGGQEVEAVGCPGDKCEHFWEEAPCCNGWRPQPASTALVEIVKELSDYLAIHHFASDRHKAADMVARARSALASSQSTKEGESR